MIGKSCHSKNLRKLFAGNSNSSNNKLLTSNQFLKFLLLYHVDSRMMND